MDVREAQGKLDHYADTYGQWIFGLSSEVAMIISEGRAALAAWREPAPENLYLSVEAVQFESISQCLAVLEAKAA